MNPPVLDRGYRIPFCANPKIYPGIVWTATAHDWGESFTHIKHPFGALNTNLHFRLSRLPVVASTHLLPLRFEYLFTLRRRWTETYPVYVNPLQDWRGAALFRCKNRASNNCCYMWSRGFSCRLKSFLVQSANIASIKKGKVYNYSCRLILVWLVLFILRHNGCVYLLYVFYFERQVEIVVTLLWDLFQCDLIYT